MHEGTSQGGNKNRWLTPSQAPTYSCLNVEQFTAVLKLSFWKSKAKPLLHLNIKSGERLAKLEQVAEFAQQEVYCSVRIRTLNFCFHEHRPAKLSFIFLQNILSCTLLIGHLACINFGFMAGELAMKNLFTYQ